jgi:hypothetical protein
VQQLEEELKTARGGFYLSTDRWLTSFDEQLQRDLKELEQQNLVQDLPELTRKGYESRIAANREKIAIIKESQKYLETFKDMSDVKHAEHLKEMLRDWNVAKDMMDVNQKTLVQLNKEIREIKRTIKAITENIEPTTNPRSAELAWDLIKNHSDMVQLENRLVKELEMQSGRVRGLNESFDLADGSSGKFRKNDFVYGRRTTTQEALSTNGSKLGSYKYGVARGFQDITAAIYTALDSPHSNGKITFVKDAVTTEIDINDLMRNPRKYRGIITEQQVDQVLKARFNGPLSENILTRQNLFFEQMEEIKPKKVAQAPVEVKPTEQRVSEAAEMAETIAEVNRQAENRRVEAQIKTAMETSEASRVLIKMKQSSDAATHRERIVSALGGDPNKIVPIGAGRSARVGDVAEILVDTVHRKFLEPFRIEMSDEGMDIELGSVDFAEKLIKISTKAIEDGSFARTYLHESFHAVLGVMENSPKFKKIMDGVRSKYTKDRAGFINANPKLAEILTATVKGEDVISGKAAMDKALKIREVLSAEVKARKLTAAQGEELFKTAYRFTDFDEYLAEILADRGLRDLEYKAAMSDPNTRLWGKAIKSATRAVDSIFQAIGKFFGKNHVDQLYSMVQTGASRVDISSNMPGSIRMLMGNPLDTSSSTTASNLDYPKEILIDGKTTPENFEQQRESLRRAIAFKLAAPHELKLGEQGLWKQFKRFL